MKHLILLFLLVCWVALFSFSGSERTQAGTFEKYRSKSPTPEHALAGDYKKN